MKKIFLFFIATEFGIFLELLPVQEYKKKKKICTQEIVTSQNIVYNIDTWFWTQWNQKSWLQYY